MTLDAGPAIARGRAAAEALMVDACTIQRKTGETTDTDTGDVTPTYDMVYSGKCRFQQRDTGAREENVAEQSIRLLRIELQLPMTVTGLQVADVVTATASVRDPDLPGRQFLVRELFHKTDATARRIRLEEVT